MTNRRKKLSAPFSTGGGGNNFETRVQAYFVTLMLAGGYAPCLPPWPIKKIKLQGKYEGYDTDDCIIFVERYDGTETRKLLCQIKHTISITKAESNKIFQEVIQAAWDDFNKNKLFTNGKDLIGLVTGPLSATDINNARGILEWSRQSDSAVDFLTKVNRELLSNKQKIAKLSAFRSCLKKANNGIDVSDEDLWQFMKSFHLLGYDLDISAGATLSSIQTLIGQYSPENAHSIWTQIINEVQMANQNAGTITVDSISEEIRSAFKKKDLETIPSNLGIAPTVPENTNWNDFEFADELAIANILGGWDEKNEADKKSIEQVSSEKYSGWISKIRKILHTSDSPLSLHNGTWFVGKRQEMWQVLGARLFDEHLDRFKEIVVRVLKEPDPQFELPPENRFAANIYGKVFNHSKVLRKALAESLALLGTQSDALGNCLRGKAESITITSIREIFEDSDWILWGSLNNLLPTLAEASPAEFLTAVENALNKVPCPFEELFSQEGNGIAGGNYMTGLLWALETLAWEEQYIVRVTVLLGKLALCDPGGNWSNRPSNSLGTIFLPWLPRTTASVQKRKVAIQTLQKECPEIAWGLLLKLLPNQHQTSMCTYKPVWRQAIPEDHGKSVNKKEYWEQVSAYSELTVEAAKGDFVKLKKLISYLDNLPESSFDKLLEYLKSKDVKDGSEEDQAPLWEALTKFINKHKKHSDTDWALDSETVHEIEQVAEKLAPQRPQNLYRRLFSKQDIGLYEESGDWQKQSQDLEKRRQIAISEIIEHGNLKAVVGFSETVESPEKVGFALGFVGNDEADSIILPDLFESKNEKIVLFASGFISGRHWNKGWEWIDKINTSDWSNGQIGRFLSYLPFKKETWRYSKQLLGESEKEYWSRANANPWQETDLNLAIDNLVKYNRPNAAISCLYGILHTKKTFDSKRAVNALLKAISSDEPNYAFDVHDIAEVIQALQDDPKVNQDDLLSVEWAYLQLLTGPGRSASPKLLEQKLASEPNFFCEIICLLYRSKKETGSERKPTEQQKNIATNAWHLLEDWRTLPGTQPDGSFSSDIFNEWLKSVKIKCAESGHLGVALSSIGKVLIHYMPDPNGLWIHKTLAETLNAKDAEKMRRGFSLGIFNSRGCHWIDPTGKPEKELVAKYRQQAEEVENAEYHRFAITLRELANSYEHEAERIIDEHTGEQQEMDEGE